MGAARSARRDVSYRWAEGSARRAARARPRRSSPGASESAGVHVARSMPQQLTLDVNGAPHRHSRCPRQWGIVKQTVPETAWRSGLNRSLRFSRATRPRDVGVSRQMTGCCSAGGCRLRPRRARSADADSLSWPSTRPCPARWRLRPRAGRRRRPRGARARGPRARRAGDGRVASTRPVHWHAMGAPADRPQLRLLRARARCGRSPRRSGRTS